LESAGADFANSRAGDNWSQGVTTTDVNLRPVANSSNMPIGLAESGSKVKVLSADNNWYEVQVVEHGGPRPIHIRRTVGWVNKRYVSSIELSAEKERQFGPA
jgi:hypothetical protein